MTSKLHGTGLAPVLGLLILCSSGQPAAAVFSNSNFTMIDSNGATFGGTNDVSASWDETLNTAVTDTNFNMNLGSDYPFFGRKWNAHHIRVFGPGNYEFDSSCTVGQIEAGQAVCAGGPSLSLNVGPDQIGAHMLWDWGETAVVENTDIVQLWDLDGIFDSSGLHTGLAGPAPALDTVYQLVSRDADGDGIAGAKMVDGAFENMSANFNLRAAVPVPAAVWLFGSGILGLLGISRRKAKH